jgi:hypothetical protein
MQSNKIYDKYISGYCEDVWEEISFRDYETFSQSEKDDVQLVIKEALQRIDYNFKIVYGALKRNGFLYKNFGNLNRFNQPYILWQDAEYDVRLEKFYIDNKFQNYTPLFFASFCSFFKVVDFRGEFNFDVPVLLDPLFIVSFNNYAEVNDLVFEREYKSKIALCCMFSPDPYVKEDESGDLGICIMLNDKVFIDSNVINYNDDLDFTFIEYLRFCFEWSCFPNLYWATEDERQPFLPLLQEVRKNLRVF